MAKKQCPPLFFHTRRLKKHSRSYTWTPSWQLRQASSSLFLPSLSLSLSLSLTLASSLPAHLLQPPPPASLFFHRSPHLLFLCQTKCTHPLILSAHYFFFLTFPLTRSAPWKQISVGGTIRCAFPHAIYKLILVWWTISKDIFSRNKTKPVMKG